tara:strand:+ start:381 stop:608 length:228 start_codon:yes stop_codon:yes gene_type:complete
MDENLFLKKVAEILSENEKDIKLETNLDTIENWDSMTILEFIVFFENEFNLEIKGEDLSVCVTIGDIHKLTKKKK